MNKLNETPKISSLVHLTYGRILNNILKKNTVAFDLKKLVENFTVDTIVPGFISKSYDQNVPEFVYNYPPIGPIPEFFECIICEEIGPHSHDINCTRPNESSLYLTEKGSLVYNKPTGTSYKLLIKKRGQKKVVSTNVKSGRFPGFVILKYENENNTFTTVKIGKNGAINISSGNFVNKRLEPDLVKKINQTDALLDKKEVYHIDPSISSTYIINSQFNLYPKEEKVFINLDAIDLNLWKTPLFKTKINTIYYFVIKRKKYIIENYHYNSGNDATKSNKQSNPYIQFTMILNEPFKINIQIYKRGAVQMRLMYTTEDFETRIRNPLQLDTIEEVYVFLKELFTILIINSSETNFPIIVSEIEKERKGILNMVDKGQPQVCHNRKGRELRPVPYSFYGVCPMENHYVRPEGKKRPDGKFEPCCYKIKKSGPDSISAIEQRYREGFNENIPDPDTLSAIFIPGTKIIESRAFKGLNMLTEKQLLDSLEHFGYIGKKPLFKNKQTVFTSLPFEKFSFSSKGVYPKDVLFISIPIDTLRVLLYFDENGTSYFINERGETLPSSISQILPELFETVIDGYYDFEENIFYPFDIITFKGTDITKNTYKMRFDILIYALEIINLVKSSLILSTNFDDSYEEIAHEEKSFIIFIPLNSVYTPGSINKHVKINVSLQEKVISLNVQHLHGNRWKIHFNGKTIPEVLLPQHEKSIKIPIVFTTQNNVKDDDIILFKINTNTNGLINYNVPLLPIEKINSHIIDYNDILNILEFLNKL